MVRTSNQLAKIAKNLLARACSTCQGVFYFKDFMTKEIQLTQDKVTLVDDDMFDSLNQWKWNYQAKGYAARYCRENNNRKFIYMHRVITNASNGMDVDHINGNGLDNRKENLRICTTEQNMANQKKRINNTSGYKGVSYHKHRTSYKKWQARLNINKKLVTVGYYATPEEAARAYDEAAKKYKGQFALLNFP